MYMDLFRNDLERSINPSLSISIKPVLPMKLRTNQEEMCFDKTFQSNIENPLRLSNYEYAFDQLHKQSNLYEEIDKCSPPSLPKRYCGKLDLFSTLSVQLFVHKQ